MNDNIKKVYEELKGGGADVGSPEEFKNWLSAKGEQGYKNRLSVYNELKGGGADVGSYDDFRNWMGFKAVKPSKPAASAAPAPARSTTPTTPVKPTPVKPKGTPITEADRQKMLANVGNMVAKTNASIHRTQNRMDYARANAGLRVPRVTIGDKNSGVRLGHNNKVVAKKPQYDPESGKIEQTYITESGNEYTDRGAADLEQNATDAYKDSMTIGGQLRDAYAERDRLDEAMKKRMKEIDERPNQRFNDFMRESAAAMTPGAGPAGELEARMSKYDNDDEYLQLMAAARKNHQTIQLLEDKKNNQMNSFWHSLGTTALNGYTFTDGMSEMRDATALTRASKHIDSINRKRAAGKPLTREEQTAETVLKNFATDNAVQGMYGGDYGAWARAGGMTANSLDFMKDLMLNPGAGSMAKGIMRGTAKGMAKGLVKVTGKEAAQLWKNNVVRRTLKATGVLIGAHTAGAYVSNTTGIGRTAATMGTLASGEVGVDDKGNYKVENAMGLLPAFAEAERQQAGENGSEMFGEFIPGVGGVVKKGLEKIGLSKLSGAMTNIGNKEWYKQYSRLLESGGYNGLPGEALEEYEGSLFDALTGHAGDAWDDMTNLQNHVDIWLGCATMGALLGSVPMMMQGHHTAQYYRYKHNTDKADNLASFRMTAERWAPLRDKIDNTDNSKMADAVTGIINNPDLHPEEKKAALNYVRNLTMMRGYNIAQVNNASDDEEQRPEVQSVNDSYSKGYDTTEPQAMNDAKNLLDMKREQVAKEHGIENVDEVDALIGDDPLRYIDEQKQLGNTDKLQSVIDYANAKSAYDGMVQRVQDDIDSRIEESNATVNSRVNRHDGMIHPASLKLQNEDGTDKKVYVVSGNVVMFDDGKGVDREKSDNTIVIRDVETGEMKVIPPDLIRGLDAAIDPEEEKAKARKAIIEEMSQTAANNVDGVVSFNEGDTYMLTDENGEQTQVTLVANEQGLVDNGDGTVNVTVDGQTVVPMSMEDIQSGVDATNMARTMQAEVERQETPEGVEYGVNDTFTLLDGDGETVHGEVQGVSDDGVEIRTDEPLNGKRVQVISAEEFESMVESINDADGNQVWAREYAEDTSDDSVPQDNDVVAPATPTTEELVQMARGGNELAQHQLEAQGVQWEEPSEQQQTALSRVPINEDTQEPMFEKADRETALDALNEVTGGNEENTAAIVNAQLEQATKTLEALKKKAPTKKAPALKGSPMAMVKAQQEAEASYNTAMEEYNVQVATAEESLNAWKRINSLMNDRKRAIREQQEAEQRERDKQLHDEAVARLEEDKRIAAEKAAEQAAVGTHAVNPKIKAKWDGATKVEGNPNAITLADGSTIRGHYVLTEAGAATASHDVNNAYEPTEGFPVDENGESVNDRDYKRDKDAQRIVRDIADNYDNRALQTPVIVSKDGVVLSGNNRTMSGEIAAKNGTDKAYVDHLREFGGMFGFTPEQIDGMQHPRVVFVPDEDLPYDASTFARFNAEQQKKQSKPEHAVKLGKIVPDNVFTSITNDISRFDRMSDYYANEEAVASAISQLLDAGVINEMQLPEFRTGNALSAAGKELIENTLIGKVFQTSPDAVRQIIGTPTLRHSVVMGLNEIANNRTLAKSGYDLSQELAAAVDLVARAKAHDADLYKEGVPVSPFGRQAGLFDEEYGDSRVTDAIVLLLSDLLNSGKPNDLRKVLATYNNDAASFAAGQMDMFSGDVTSKEDLLKNVLNYFRNATPREQQAIVDAAIAERKQRAKASEQVGDTAGRSGEAKDTGEHSLSSQNTEPKQTITLHDPRTMSDEEKERRGEMLRDAYAIDVAEGQIVATVDMSARKAAEKWWNENVPESVFYDTEAGEVEINKTSIEDSLAHRYGQAKLDAITSLVDGFENAVYLGTLPDFVRQEGVNNHYFAFPINYKGERSYVFCRAMQDANKNRLYVHEVFVADKIKKGNTLQTAAFQPHGGIALYRDILANVLDRSTSGSKVTNNTDAKQENEEKSADSVEDKPLSAKIDAASAEVNTNPTEAQKEAGNYKKGHVQVGTFDITIEQPQGSVRKGKDADGKEWESKMNNTYGYIRGAVGVDGDHIDVFLSNDIDGWNGRKVYVVDQYNPDGSFDEHKVMLGFNDQDEAKGDYLANYENGWEDGRRIDVTAVNLEDFEKWIESSKRKTKPFGEYASVKKDVVEINTPRAGYTITPATYTNKKGKTSNVSLLTFDHDLTADQERAVKEFAKERTGKGRFAPARGWKDRESGGWMFRSEEDARKAAEMVGNDEAVADNQPMTAQELRDAVEPKKPTTSKKTASKKPANRVESVPTEEPIEPEKPKYEVSDEEMNGLMNDIRDILGIGDDEGDAGLKFRDPDELTAEQRQKLMSVGQRLAMAMVERGHESFGDYAMMMVKALGDKVRPWLKAFYGGLEYVPGYDKYALTPYEEVKAFDVENFDKPNKDVMAQANMIVEEDKAQVAAEKANNELKATRNEQRKETEKQTAANTDAVAAEAESVASEATALAETSSDEQELTESAEHVDEALDKVNEQLALLGYYEADEVEKDYNEAMGYMRNAEKKAVKDAANLASQLIEDLGLDSYEATHSKQTDKKGNRKRKPLAVANIAPVGGDVSIHLPLAEGRELYVNIQLVPSAGKGVTNFGGDNLEVTGIMFRVDNPDGAGNDRLGRNEWVDNDVTYSELLKQVEREAYKYIPERTEVAEGEYKVGDKVEYSADGGHTWSDAVVAQPNDDGGIRIDTGLAPYMWVNAHPDQLRHKAKAGTISDAELVKRITEHPLFKELVDDNPDAQAARTLLGEKIMTDVRLSLRKDGYVDTYKKLLGDNDFSDKIADKAFAKRKIEPKTDVVGNFYEDIVAITDAMKANAMVAPTVEINDANWKESVDTPIGSVKMGENQKAKLFAKGREMQYGMLLETLSNPDVVLEEKDKEQNMLHERPSSYLFVKTFQKEDGSKYVHFESVTVSQEGMEVSVSSHIIRENQLKNKLKSDRLLYKATALDAPANTSAEQPIVGGSLSSVGKDTTKVAEKQGKGKKKVKPGQQVGDLFAGLLDEPNNNGLQGNDDAVRAQGVQADGGGQQQGPGEGQGGTRKAAAQEGGRPDGGRGGQSTGKDRAVSAGLHGLTQPKNTRNNHSERGADHAPTSVNGRIEANIKAIELAHELLESGETATPEQMSVLRQFSGWGGLGAAFKSGGYDWKQKERNKKIRELLGGEAYDQAVMSANSAYYTPAYVVDTLWDIAKQLGFKGGNILEGSAGIGNILGQMPMTMSERSDIHAIEIDGTSGGILSLLYPDAKVDIQGFEQTRIPNGSVDLAITNVPFVTGLRVNDTTGDSDLSKKFHNIHDFCIAKNVRKLREGGLGIFISSNGTLDGSKALRDWVVNDGGSDFIGAFRMNNKTFGGTTVTSDIIVIRKRVNGVKSAQAIDVSSISGERTAEYEEPGARKAKQLSMDYNKYFLEHPDHMAGEMRFAFEEGDTFRPTSKGLYPVSGKDQGKMLADFVKSFTEEERSSVATTDDHDVSLVLDASADGKKLGEMYMKDGRIVLASFGGYYPLEVNDKKIKGHTKQECFTAYAAIKTALADVMKYQTENEDNAGLEPLIEKLNKAYDDFVNTYGHLNKNNQLAWLRNDVDYPNVFSLETYSEQGDGKGGVLKTYGKADVMKGRVVEKESEPHPENVKDGVVVSMFKNGRIDVPYIAGQLGKSEAEVKREIVESGLGFEDPTTRQMEVSYKYLSGNVREKLKQAEANNENGEYSKNIKALQEVVPMNIPSHLIDFTLGSSWLDPKLYGEYAKERTDIDAHFTAAGGTWFMKAPRYGVDVEKNRAMGIVSEMLGKTIMGHELIEAAIQNKSVIVSRTEKHSDGTTETITDREATAACAAKIDEIRQDFKDWMREKMQGDADLSARMEQEYNDRFNNYVPMSIPDEFVPEYFGGAAHKFKMRPHQGKAIVRGTMQPLLLAHEVGTGKTFTLISTAMEMRRLGTARKPMIVVQNATVGQFAASAKELYPNAKILTLEDNDRNSEGRKNFYAKIKYNDWDMIVVPQSTFEFIPDSDERKMQFVQDKIDEKMLVLEQMRKSDSSGRNAITRRAEKELADLQAELAALTDNASKKRTANDEKKKAVAKQNAAVKAQEMLNRRTDDVENFDDMGIDALLIDEAHEYKHLGFATAMQRGVKGVDPSYSKKSQGVYLKTQAVLEKNNGRNVVFATGTPISNTAAEIWTFMRYLMPKDTMKEYGIYYFDDFVRNFGNIQQMPEFNTSGKFKEVNRFAGYVNLPELVRIWSGVADTVLTKDQTELVKKIPELEGGKAQDIYLPQTRALRSVMKYVRKELERFDEMSGKEKKENSSIPLTMYGIAQGAAVDARLVEMHAEDDLRSKTNEAVRQTLRSLKETDDYKGTVAIFADHYQNKHSGFNLYEDIRKKLVANGVAANEVVVMKPGMTIKKKLEIFEKVNRGEVRVILGSTATLGTGVNIQERLHTLIHLDAPNRPMDYTQRNGRILRQGNLHKKWGKPVRVLRFGVEDSLDVTAYQRLKTKGAIADSVMEGDRLMRDSMNNRVLEEEEDVFGDTVAQLSGSEYALLKNNAEKNVRKYESRKKQWKADQAYIHYAKPRIEGQIKANEKRADEANKLLLAVQRAFPDGKFNEITVGKHKFGSVDDMADFIKDHNKKILDAVKAMKENPTNETQTNTVTLSLGGFDFVVKTEMVHDTLSKDGLLFAEIHRIMTYSCPELGLNDVPVKQSLLRNAIEDITENVITGNDFAERFDAASRLMQHQKSELELLKQREGKPFEYEKELEEAERQLEEYSEAMMAEMAEKEKKYAEMDANVKAATDVVVDEDDESEEDKMKFRLLEEDDPKAVELEALPDSELVPVYRNVQAFEDDALGSPMAFTDAETGERRTLEGRRWNYSAPPKVELTEEQQRKLDELNKNGYIMVDGKKSTELQINDGLKFVKPKTKEAQLQYFLKKNPEDKGLWAAYDPYDHAIETPLNTQFGEAYKRPNLVVVRSLIPKSEIDEPFQADYALLPTGAHQWNNGRTLYLSRWSKIDKVLTREEEAKLIDEYWKKHPGKREELKSHRDYNRFVPQVRRELEKMGYRFELDGKELTPEESLALDKQNWESRDVIPGREGHTPFVSNEDIERINAKMAGKWVGEPKEAMERAMSERVAELSELLHTPVRIIRTEEEVAALPSARQRRMKGSFNPMTGEVTIVVPNNANMADIENTFVHEVVGHDGLRVLFPDEAKLNNALDELYRVSNSSIRQAIDRMAQKMYDAEVDRLREKKRKEHEARGEDANASYYADMAEAHAEASGKRDQMRRDATDEYGAGLAGRIGESGFEKMSADELTFWGRLKSMIEKALQKLLEGLKIPGKKKWGDKEWAFVYHEAYKRKKNGGRSTVFDAADTEVMRRKTGFGDVMFSESRSSGGSRGSRYIEDMKQKVEDLFEKARTGDFVGKPASIGRLSVDGKAYLEKLSGLKFKEFVDFVLNPSDLNHIRSDHYGENEKDKGNNVPLTDEDIQNMVDVLNQPDGILYGVDKKDGRKLFFFLKDAGNGLYNLTEVCSTKKGNLTAKSFFKSKKKGISQRVMEIKDSLLPTSVTYSGESLSSDAKIPPLFENGKVSDENLADEGIMFRDGKAVDYEKAQARDAYERRVASGLYQSREALQDSMLGLHEAMQAVLKAEGRNVYIEDVDGYENAYLGENRLSSVNQAEISEYARRLFKPMLAEVSKLAKTDEERAALTDYMMAKHGLERNEVMARRAAAKDARMEFLGELAAAELAVDNDPLDQDAIDALDDVKQRMREREDELYVANRKRDYSGLTALTGMKKVAKAEAEAERMVADYERSHKTAVLWGKVFDVTQCTLRKTYECGLIDRKTYKDISTMYKHYIPLRGFDEKTSGEAYAYLQDKRSGFNAAIKRAKGRKSKADDPFANMQAMAESAIMQGNRNVLVKQKFLNFVLNHPSDLVSVSDLWLRYDDAADEWRPINTGDVAGTEALEADDSAADVERKMAAFEAAMVQLQKSDPKRFRRQREDPTIPYRVVTKTDLREHQVIVKRNGRDYVLTINGNPRAAQAVNGQTNPDSDVSGAIGKVMELGEKVNRELSAFYTTRNPDFVVSNFARDAMYANSMAWLKESPNYAWRFNRNFARFNPVRMKVLFGKYREGRLDMNDETEKLFYQFMMNGGETGYSIIKDIDRRKNDIRRELKMNNGKLPIRKGWMLLGERCEEYNRAVENCARFAAFVTSRQMKRSIDRSIYDAKEISVNFNKKGSGAKFMGAEGQTWTGNTAAFVSGSGRALYVFWNAALQGTFNFGKQVKRHPKKALSGIAAMFLLGFINAAIGGDDDDDGDVNSYWNLPGYVRRNNIVFRAPGMKKSWISLPLPPEYRSIYGMGELAASVISGKEHFTDGELAGEIAGQVSQLFPIDFMEGGSPGWKPFVPSSVKPFAEVWSNESWTGMPIYNDHEWNKNDPEWTKVYKSANGYLVEASKWLNEATGGDKYTSGAVDINPAKVEHVLNGYFGGVAGTVDKLTKMGETLLGDREYDARSFLVLNRLLKNGDERTAFRAVNNEYFRLKDEHDKIKHRLKGYEDDTYNGVFDYADKISWLNSSPEYRRMLIYEDYSLDINALNTELKDVTLSDEERKKTTDELNELKRQLVYASDFTRMNAEELQKEREKLRKEREKVVHTFEELEIDYYLKLIGEELKAHGRR